MLWIMLSLSNFFSVSFEMCVSLFNEMELVFERLLKSFCVQDTAYSCHFTIKFESLIYFLAVIIVYAEKKSRNF